MAKICIEQTSPSVLTSRILVTRNGVEDVGNLSVLIMEKVSLQ